MKRLPRAVRIGCLGITLACLLAAGISIFSNQFLPKSPQALDRLDPLDKTRLAEALNLQDKLGEAVWPGWGTFDGPVILSNGEYDFLIGHPSPPSEWAKVEGDSFSGRPYYRKGAEDHQNFAVLVGDQWAASMATKQYTDEFLISKTKEILPPVIEQVFPYRVLLQPSETQISGLIHEAFHVYQAIQTPQRLAAAEEAHKLELDYARYQEASAEDWKKEAKALERALNAETNAETIQFTREFLSIRNARRQAVGLPEELVAYERWLEWEEGLAKYIELAMWKAGHAGPYEPMIEMSADPDFKAYKTFPNRWTQNLMELNTQAGQDGEGRFYYSGMAQSFLLDKLSPGWNDRIFKPGVWLEDLLAEAVD